MVQNTIYQDECPKWCLEGKAIYSALCVRRRFRPVSEDTLVNSIVQVFHSPLAFHLLALAVTASGLWKS